ncbi:MAG: ComF family protein [Acidimicrobiia bacterium]
MAARLPAGATALVPVRRSMSRRIGYGIDQASFLAHALGDVVGLPVVDAVTPPLWWRRRAGAPLEERTAIAFRARRAVPGGAVLIDDVLTTGTTVLSAADALAPARLSFLVATAAGRMDSRVREVPNWGGDVAKNRRATETRSPVVLPCLPEQSFERVVGFGAPVFESA